MDKPEVVVRGLSYALALDYLAEIGEGVILRGAWEGRDPIRLQGDTFVTIRNLTIGDVRAADWFWCPF